MPWAHLDVAGTAWADEAKPWMPKGASGVAVRTLAELAFTACDMEMMVQQANPIIVHVIETPVRSTTVADVLLGSIGLAGVLVLAALLLGACSAAGSSCSRSGATASTKAGTADSGTIHIV